MKDELSNDDISLVFNSLREEERAKNIKRRKERMLEPVQLSSIVRGHNGCASYHYAPRYRSYRSPVIKVEDVNLPLVRDYPIRSNIIKAGTYIIGRNPIVIEVVT